MQKCVFVSVCGVCVHVCVYVCAYACVCVYMCVCDVEYWYDDSVIYDIMKPFDDCCMHILMCLLFCVFFLYTCK